MSRRSARLVTGGYYQSDEDSDSSTVTSVSYRESPVRVFKKRTGGRKTASRTSSRANSVASTVSSTALNEPITNAEEYIGMAPALREAQRKQTMWASPSSTPAPTHLPVLSPAPTPGPVLGLTRAHRQSPSPGVLSGRGSLLREKLQGGVESSGYSSSEGLCSNTATITSSGSGSYGRRVPLSPPAPNSKHSTCSSAGVPFSPKVRKAVLVLLILILLTFGVWSMLPIMTLMTQNLLMNVNQPVMTTPPIIPPPPRTMERDSGLNLAIEEKMQKLLRDIELKQQRLVSEVELRLQTDIRGISQRVESVVSQQNVRLDQEVSGLSWQIRDLQSDTHSATSGLMQRLETQLSHTTKLEQELSSIKMAPPPAPCPETPAAAPSNELTPELKLALEKWFSDRVKDQQLYVRQTQPVSSCKDCGPLADRMADFALETQGASVISTRCSETYRTRSACVTLFGFPLWYPSESPRTVIQGNQVLLPGKCWAFHGVQGTLVLSLSHPVRITHVTLDHLPRCNSPTGRIDSAPRDFEVYGMSTDSEEGNLLGKFTYDQDGEPTQTFKLPDQSGAVHRFVELRILSNWGHVEYTCVYRFRVHGQIAGA
ncbi:SUN domain-containing protein 2 isoform X2 [Osmerus mordax]|uniref:SUN domain-containing protein 2 isoform X2 n=1 Tax=Osmerus mordax TaxID=8014 RepID=UPI00350F39A6